MHSRILIIGSLAVFFLGAIFLTGCRKHYSHEDRIKWISGKIASKLDLDQTQKTKLKSIEDEVLQRSREMKDAHKEIFELVKGEIKKDAIDKEKLLEVMKKNEKKTAEFKYFLVDKAVEFHGILKSGQKEKIYDHMVKAGQKHGF